MIHVSHLTKTFGLERAVDDISFDLARGQVLGFLGPNGAGKSTTMRVLTCYLPPTSGDVTIDGKSVSDAVESDDIAAAPWREQHETIAADPRRSGLDHALHRTGRDRRIHGIAAVLQHLDRGHRRQRVRRRRHTVRGVHGRAAG